MMIRPARYMQTIFKATETPPDKKPRNKMLLGLCIGALSGAVTSVVGYAADNGFWMLRILATPFLVGGIFGAVFSTWFWRGMEKRSLAKALGFIAACAAAYIAAFDSAFFSVFIFGGGDAQKDSRMIAGSPAGSFFIGGSVGGFIVIAAAMVLFSEQGKPLRLISRAVAYSPLGGAFGLLAWVICSLVVPVKSASESGSEALEIVLLWLVWQTGMGGLLGALLLQEHRSSPSALPVAKRGAPSGLNVARVLLVLICLAAVVYFVVPEIPRQYQAVRSQRAYKKHLSERPSLQSATAVQPRPVEQVLILQSFGEYLPGKAAVSQSNTFVVPKTGKPMELRAQWYTVRYQRQEELVFPPKSYVDVTVVEFPGPSWAKYEVGTWTTGLQVEDLYAAGGMAHTRIFSERKQPSAKGLDRFVWTSGALLVEVRSYSADARCAEAYLEKYPSTL